MFKQDEDSVNLNIGRLTLPSLGNRNRMKKKKEQNLRNLWGKFKNLWDKFTEYT